MYGSVVSLGKLYLDSLPVLRPGWDHSGQGGTQTFVANSLARAIQQPIREADTLT